MFLTINLKEASNLYVLYKLTTQDGKTIHLGIVPLRQLTTFADVPADIRAEHGDTYLSIIMTHVDRLVLVNHGMATDDPVLTERLTQAVQSWSNTANGKAIECIETGETFGSAAACATAHNLTYGALLNHLKGTKSHNTVKGRTYRRIG